MKTRVVRAGSVKIGGANPVAVQSMCSADTRDARAVIAQIKRLEAAGCELVRVAVPDEAAALAIGKIKKGIKIPLVADIHFDYRLALTSVKQGADKARINPGNIGEKWKVREVAKACKDSGIPIRIGVNAGSLKALSSGRTHSVWTCGRWARVMVSEALEQVNLLESMGFRDIVVSLKADDINRTLAACRLFAAECDIPLHLGITEAGALLPGAVKSAVGLGLLLSEGIGSTIRVSLTDEPEAEVRCAFEILKALGLRRYGPEIISCPTCGRCRVNVVGVVKELEKKIYGDPVLRRRAEGLKIAVMGCAVNGPGEAREADFGIAGGAGEGLWFEKGVPRGKLPQKRWIAAVIAAIKRIKK